MENSGLSLLSLRTAFSSIFPTEQPITAAVLTQMIAVQDSYNFGHYQELTEADLWNKFEKRSDGAGYQLYSRRDTAKETSEWTRVKNIDTQIPSSVELYLQKLGTSGRSEDDYVQIYSLLKLKPEYVRGEDPIFQCQDKLQILTAIVYALCCYGQKLVQLQIRDVEIMNDELREINRILMRLTSMQKEMNDLQKELTRKPPAEQSREDRPKRPVDQDIFLFFLKRNLLTAGLLVREVQKNGDEEILPEIAALRDKIFGTPETPGTLQRFQQWTQFTSLVGHGSLLGGLDRPDVIAEKITGISEDIKGKYNRNEVNANFYDPVYWKQTVALVDNPCPGSAGLGEHYVFDPRLRDIHGNVLNRKGTEWDGKDIKEIALVPGFKLVENPADPKPQAGETQATYLDYSVRSYGPNPPSNAKEWLKGVATMLQRDNFLAAAATDTFGNPVRVFQKSGNFYEFDQNFLEMLVGGREPSFSDFTIKTLTEDEIDDSKNRSAFVTLKFPAAGQTPPPPSRFARLTAAIQKQYWPVNEGDNASSPQENAWQKFVGSFVDVERNKSQIIAEQVAIWTDTERIYNDRKNSETTLKTSQLQRDLQETEKNLTTASNFDKAICRNKQGAIINLR